MSDVVPLVEIHSRVVGFYEVPAGNVRALEWSASVSPPWDTIKATLAMPRWNRDLDKIQIGDWIVLRHPGTRVAVAWGFIDTLAGGMAIGVAGAVRSSDVTLTAISWLSMLGRASVVIAPAFRRKRIGTLFPLEGWATVIEQLLSTVRGDIGSALADVFALIADVTLPPTLSGTPLASAVPVVWDDRTRDVFAPDRTIDPIRGPSLQGLYSLYPSGSSILDLLQSTFLADASMVEMFPSLERPGSGADPRPAKTKLDIDTVTPSARMHAASVAAKLVADLDAGIALSRSALRDAKEAQRSTIAEPAQIGGPATDAARTLRVNPVLVYRIRPWRTQALSAWTRQQSSVRGFTPENLRSDLFTEITWDSRKATRIPADRITGYTWQLADGNRVNVVTVGLPTQPDSPLRFWSRSGLPIAANYDVATRGLRLYSPQWPFFPPPTNDDGEVDTFVSYIATVAAQAAQFHFGAERFLSGVVNVEGIVDVPFGAPFHAELPGAAHAASAEPDGLIGYAEAVTRRIVADGDRVVGATAITYSRGLHSEADAILRVRPFLHLAKLKGR